MKLLLGTMLCCSMMLCSCGSSTDKTMQKELQTLKFQLQAQIEFSQTQISQLQEQIKQLQTQQSQIASLVIPVKIQKAKKAHKSSRTAKRHQYMPHQYRDVPYGRGQMMAERQSRNQMRHQQFPWF